MHLPLPAPRRLMKNYFQQEIYIDLDADEIGWIF